MNTLDLINFWKFLEGEGYSLPTKNSTKLRMIVAFKQKFSSPREPEADECNEQTKEFCTFDTTSHMFCSRYHDCKYCDMQPRPSAK